jgi:plastocyanin
LARTTRKEFFKFLIRDSSSAEERSMTRHPALTAFLALGILTTLGVSCSSSSTSSSSTAAVTTVAPATPTTAAAGTATTAASATPTTAASATPTTAAGTATTAAASTGALSSAATVDIKQFKFGPAETHIAIGGTVTWTNSDNQKHTATSSGGFDTGAIEPGSTGKATFAKAGTFAYICSFHPFMKGTIIVGS